MAEYIISADYMEDEMKNFFKVWFSVFVSLCYCYIVGKLTSKGLTRLLCLIPVFCLFFFLPLNLVTMHLAGFSSFFIAFLANFKLLLFAFGKGPLCSDPSISLGIFVALACLPIKIQQNPSPNSPQNPKKGKKSPLNYALKGILTVILIRVYDYTDYIKKIHPNLIWVVLCLHTYFSLELILAMVASVARTFLSLELEPQFNKPYLASSLQDFWGRRWNLMVTNILRPTVYKPVLGFSARVIGRNYAPLPAVFGTFVVSALMHELIFYYLGRMWPTWEITKFFLLHGFCLMIEIALKKEITGKFRMPRVMSGLLAVGFVVGTGFWLFFPSLFRCKAIERALLEYEALGGFVRGIGRAVSFVPMNTTSA